MTTQGYDDASNRISLTDANNHTTTYTYDELNPLVTVTDALNHSISQSYDAAGNKTGVTDANNHTTTYTFDALNRMTAITDPNGHSTGYGFDAAGNRTSVTGARNHTTTYTYDAANRLTRVTNALNHTTMYGYNNFGQRTNVTAANRVTGQTDRDANQTLTVGYVFGYDETNNRTSETESRPNRPDRTTTYGYDELNRNTSVTDPYNNTTGYTYDAAGNLTNTTDALGISTNVTPNAVNLPETITRTQNSSALDTTTNTYDPRNNLQSAVTNAPYPTWTLNLTTTSAYNDNNYLQARQDSTQGIYNSSFSFNPTYYANNLMRTMGPIWGGDYTVIYDGVNRVNCNVKGWGGPQWWAYYPNGNRKYHFYGYNPIRGCAQTDDPGTWWTAVRDEYTYAGQQLVTRELHSYVENNNSLLNHSAFTYDGAGNLTSETKIDYQNNITTTVAYDWNYEAGAQRLTKFTAANGVTTTLEYDALGRISHRTTAQGSSDYIYNGASDWLLKETWHAATSGQTFDLVRYGYVNGAPFVVEIAAVSGDKQSFNGYTKYYLQANYHGDLVTTVEASNGNGGQRGWFDPW